MWMLDAVKEAIEHLKRDGPIGRGLDIGTGGGYVAMSIAGHVGSAVGTDIDQDLVDFASANATASGICNIEFGISDICAAVSGEFDIIMSNPPQSISDPSRHTSGTHDRGGHLGQEIIRRVLEESWDHLSERGCMVIGFSSPIVNGRCTIYDTVDELFGDRGARVEIRELLYDYYPEHGNFYRELGIEKILRGTLMIERAQSFGTVSSTPAPEMLRASQVHTAVARLFGRLFY
jgi:methylase of polypeptide subunit release factors